MRNATPKRQAALRVYNRVKAEKEIELKQKGEWRCFFSGIPIPDFLTWKEVAHHHIVGRKNDLLIDKKFIVPVSNDYHTVYHDKPTSYLKTLWWWRGFMDRLKALDENVWYSHKLRESK